MGIIDGVLVPSPVWGGLPAFKLHFGYNRWANAQILRKMGDLSDAQLNEPQQTNHGSAFQLMLHLIDTEWGWRIIAQDGIKTPYLWEVESIPDMTAMAVFWRAETDRMNAYLDSMKEIDLDRDIDIGTIMEGNPRISKVHHLLTHILYHSASHRSELATYLTQCGHSPGDMEFLDYLEKASAASSAS